MTVDVLTAVTRLFKDCVLALFEGYAISRVAIVASRARAKAVHTS